MNSVGVQKYKEFAYARIRCHDCATKFVHDRVFFFTFLLTPLLLSSDLSSFFLFSLFCATSASCFCLLSSTAIITTDSESETTPSTSSQFWIPLANAVGKISELGLGSMGCGVVDSTIGSSTSTWTTLFHASLRSEPHHSSAWSSADPLHVPETSSSPFYSSSQPPTRRFDYVLQCLVVVALVWIEYRMRNSRRGRRSVEGQPREQKKREREGRERKEKELPESAAIIAVEESKQKQLAEVVQKKESREKKGKRKGGQKRERRKERPEESSRGVRRK